MRHGLEEFAQLPPNVQTPLFADASQATPAQKTELKEYYRDNFLPELKTLNGKLAATRQAEKDLNGKIPSIRVMEDMPEPRVTQIRVRGDYRNKGDKVVAGVPHVLPPLPPAEKTNRLALAKWLTDPKHPLLSRVTVNRYWALYFGTGLVKTGNEFGTQGELPSHPELLDWLACEFIDSGWNIKALQKNIVMSATYRQASKPTPELLALDPGNRLLARGPRLRLSAEVIRDCALDYAGLLDRKRAPGGPSVKPYQPAGLWEEKMFGGNKYEESTGADLYRRSLYTLWKRTVLNPTHDDLRCAGSRDLHRAAQPDLHAIAGLRDPERKGLCRGRARVRPAHFAAGRRKSGSTDQLRLPNSAGPPAVSRKREKSSPEVHADMVAAYQKNLKAAVDLITTGAAQRIENLNELELVAWTATANVLLNLDETITKE